MRNSAIRNCAHEGRVEPVPPNPFHYGTPVAGDQFVGRGEELDALVSRMRSGINVVLLSPRRYGKTSLLLRAEEVLSRSQPAPAIVSANVLRCRDLATLASQLTTALYQVPGARWHRVRQGIPEFLSRLRLRPTVSINDQGRPIFGFDTSLAPADADDVVADVYRVLDEQAERRPSVLVLDEFQAITDHGAHLPQLFKALADTHPGVALVVAGSKRHLMERLVSDHEAPLYGMAQRLALGPIPDEVMVDFLIERAAAGGRATEQATAQRIVAVVGPVPNDIQRLAYEAFGLAGPTLDEAAVAAGLDRAVGHEAATYADMAGRRTPAQRRVLVMLAVEPAASPFSSRFARAAGLAGGSSVKRVLDTLESEELVAYRQGAWSIDDPFFAAWLRPAASSEGGV